MLVARQLNHVEAELTSKYLHQTLQLLCRHGAERRSYRGLVSRELTGTPDGRGPRGERLFREGECSTFLPWPVPAHLEVPQLGAPAPAYPHRTEMELSESECVQAGVGGKWLIFAAIL